MASTGNTHTVKPGDTMSAIAVQYHLTLGELLRLNPQITNANLIQPGQVLRLSGGEGGSGGGAGAGDAQTHEVQRGESLSQIAMDHKLTLAELLQANPQIQDPNLIRVGQKLSLPHKKSGAGHPDAHPATHPHVKQKTVALAEADWMPILYDELGLWRNGRGAKRESRYRRETALGGADWCSIFANWVMQRSQRHYTRSAMAESWVNYGTKLKEPRPGALVILSDGFMNDPKYPNNPWFHVTFFKRSIGGGIECVGGNQGGGRVTSAQFYWNRTGRIIKSYPITAEYRWPSR